MRSVAFGSLKMPFQPKSASPVEHQVWGHVEGMSSNSSDSHKADKDDVKSKSDFSHVVFHTSDTSSGLGEGESPSQGPMRSPKNGNAGEKADPTARSSAAAEAADEEEPDAEADALSSRQPSWSQGAVLHAAGACKPCAWNWKPRGCAQGAACVFCHLCDQDAHRQYRKGRLAGLKANRAKRKNKGYEPPGHEAPQITRFSL